MATKGDIIITSYPINKDYIRYLSSLHLEIAADIELLVPSVESRDLASSILNDNELLNYLRNRTSSGHWFVETFLYSKSFEMLLKTLGLPLLQPIGIFKKYGTKSGFKELGKSLELPMPEGIVTRGYESKKIMAFSKIYPKVVIKSNDTLGGVGVSIVESPQYSIKKFINNKIVYVIEEQIESKNEGSIQIFIDNGTYDLVIDETVMSGTHFIGFKYPYNYEQKEIEKYGTILANFLLKEGVIKGYYSIDFIVSNYNKIFFHDFNPRKTGVSYVLLFLYNLFGKDKIKQSSIVSKYINLPLNLQWNLINIINKLNPVLYGYGMMTEGIFLFNPSLLRCNILHLISLSFCGKEEEYLKIAEQRLDL
jgi:hypothetical protein